jgi:phage-related protein
MTNNGNFPSSRAVITIGGPGAVGGGGSQLYTIANLTTGFTIRLNMTLIATDVVIIDLNQKTITFNGVDSYSFRRPDSQWFALNPGVNAIQVTRPHADAVNANIAATWYDAWNSV